MERQANGEPQECTPCYPRLPTVARASAPIPDSLAIRFQLSGETEGVGWLDLLKELADRLGRRSLDVLAADAICVQTPCSQEVESPDLEWVAPTIIPPTSPQEALQLLLLPVSRSLG